MESAWTYFCKTIRNLYRFETGTLFEGLICEIRGKKTIAAGKTNEYTAIFYDRDGTVVDDVEPQWTISEGAENASLVVTDGKAKLAANKQAFVGATVRLCLKAQGYTPKYKDVEVKAYG